VSGRGRGVSFAVATVGEVFDVGRFSISHTLMPPSSIET
jgi:hypothetical protein